jgi:hypothetical protein
VVYEGSVHYSLTIITDFDVCFTLVLFRFAQNINAPSLKEDYEI